MAEIEGVFRFHFALEQPAQADCAESSISVSYGAVWPAHPVADLIRPHAKIRISCPSGELSGAVSEVCLRADRMSHVEVWGTWVGCNITPSGLIVPQLGHVRLVRRPEN